MEEAGVAQYQEVTTDTEKGNKKKKKKVHNSEIKVEQRPQ